MLVDFSSPEWTDESLILERNRVMTWLGNLVEMGGKISPESYRFEIDEAITRLLEIHQELIKRVKADIATQEQLWARKAYLSDVQMEKGENGSSE